MARNSSRILASMEVPSSHPTPWAGTGSRWCNIGRWRFQRPMRSSDRPTLFLWTPIPPAKTGTADYVTPLLQEAPPGLFERFRLHFVVDPAAGPATKQFQEHAVIGPEAAVPKCHDHTIF